jgi:hypothetical protein
VVRVVVSSGGAAAISVESRSSTVCPANADKSQLASVHRRERDRGRAFLNTSCARRFSSTTVMANTVSAEVAFTVP